MGSLVNGAQEKTFKKSTINNSDRLVFTHFICLILLISPLKYASEACKHKRMNIYESSQRNDRKPRNSCCPDTLASAVGGCTYCKLICILSFIHQSLPFTNNTREQLYMCGNVCMCDPRLHNLVSIQQSLTFFVIHHSAW